MVCLGRVILLSLAFLLYSQHVFALRVLVIEPERSDSTLYEAFGRVRAELELQTFEVVVLKRGTDRIETTTLESEAQAHGAFAAVALQRDENSTTADLWIVDRVTGKIVLRKLKIDDGKDGPTLLAIRAVDLLRTSLTELAPGERPPSDVVGVDQTTPPLEVAQFAQSLPTFQLKLGAAILAHPSLGVSAGTAVDVIYHPLPRISLGLKFVGPVFGGEYHAPNGDASVRQEFGTIRAAFNFGASRPGPRWEWGPAMGIGASHLSATGVVDPPLVAMQNNLWALALLGGLNVAHFFTDFVSLDFEVAALCLIPQPVIAVADQQSSPLTVQGLATLSLGISF